MIRSLAPASDPWTLAVYRNETGSAPIGTAVAVSARMAVTCAHVVLDGFDEPGGGRLVAPLWVSFPRAASALGWKIRRLVVRVEYDVDDPQIADVAVLHLAEDMPAAIEPARLKLLEPEVLAGSEGRPGLRWWAFGFPASSRRTGNEASGTVGARLAYGWVRLDTDSPYPVEKGFSGGGLWLPQYGAVAGIVGQAMPAGKHRGGDAQALTLAQAAVFLPSAKLQVLAGWAAPDAGAAAMAAWGWQLATDPEAGRHWRPRSRGVMTDLDRGYRFQGRTAALTRIVEWLDRAASDRRMLVVTGSPGVGKSAVLGRVVTTADSRLLAELPAEDVGVVASIGSVGCAVHAKGKTALDVATEIASAAGAVLPDRVEDLAAAVHAVLARGSRRFNIVIDAIDEAATVADAREVLTGVVLPLVQACGDIGVQVVCGSRRYDAGGHLLGVLTGAGVEVDLDEPEFFELADLTAYTLATLRLVGSERPGNPYGDPVVAGAVAARIAVLAEPNFLVAGLDARTRGMYDTVAADPATLTLTATVGAALDAYLDRVPPVDGIAVRAVLTALAYAEAPGWSSEVWQVATAALGSPASDVQLERFARSAAAGFLVETSTTADVSVFRLFHQALNDTLLRDRGPGGVRADERRLTLAMLTLGRERTWADAPPYLLRSLAGHADRAGLIDELLTDDIYLLFADLPRLLPAANRARTETGRSRVRLLRLTPQAAAAPPRERMAMFSITQALEQLVPLTTDVAGPYRARWTRASQRAELRRFDGHTSGLTALCTITIDGQNLLASAGVDGTIRIWNPTTGTQHQQLNGDSDGVNALCAINVEEAPCSPPPATTAPCGSGTP
ncbi:NACHT and WD repeat domain-containing protein [Dactylosporangium cerinum]